MKKKILVIAPHADDEVLGVGGYLIHEAAKGSESHFVIGALGGTDIRQDIKVRKKELSNVCDYLGVESCTVLFEHRDAELDTIPSKEIIGYLDNIINILRPDEIFVNYRSHHQDHKKIYDCAMASLRLREGYTPKMVALYEYPFVGGSVETIQGGRWYHDISDVMDQKITLFNLYESQIRESPSPLNSKGVRSLASIRGLECGVEFAEMFYVQTLVR